MNAVHRYYHRNPFRVTMMVFIVVAVASIILLPLWINGSPQ